MSTMWFCRYKILIGIAALLLATWYVVFEWDWLVYTDGRPSDERCYSPNHEYYVVRLQTPIRTLLEPIGTAKLYDKSGKLLYKARTVLTGEAGPRWYDEFAGKSSSVMFIGNLSDEWEWRFDLPSSPGNNPSKLEKRCF